MRDMRKEVQGDQDSRVLLECLSTEGEVREEETVVINALAAKQFYECAEATGSLYLAAFVDMIGERIPKSIWDECVAYWTAWRAQGATGIEAWDGDSESMHNDPAVIARDALSDE